MISRVRLRTKTVSGDELFDALVATHCDALMLFAIRVAGNRERAEDIVQETLLRAWQHPEALDGSRGSPRAWLFTVARRVAIDSWRRDKRRQKTEGENTNSEMTESDLREHLNQLVDEWIISAALESLSPEHREVLVQTIWLNRSVTDVAKITGVPPGTVKSRTYYALRALRLSLEEIGFFS